MGPDELPVGATPLDDGSCAFLVWAPRARRVELALADDGRSVPMEPLERGYHGVVAESVIPGARYRYRLDGGPELPDPASRSQPEGVHGPSEVVDPAAFAFADPGWSSPPLAEQVIYELHVGTFTEAGTFDGAIERLDDLAELGVTTVELMPVAQFPGSRNWGYDGVFPSAAQDGYGGPSGLARLVDACHRRGLAVLLDVVHNHLGPEGNVLPRFGPYLSDRHATPWGPAVNLDGPGNEEVRRYLIESALGWLERFRLDGLRLDAIHAIVDDAPDPLLAQLSETVDDLAARSGRRLHLIAETPDNDARVVAPREEGGLGMHAVWSDDFHHALHVELTGERNGHFVDYDGLADLATTLRDGWTLQGRTSAFRGRPHGTRASGIPADRFVVFAQDHDQVGNRMRGERLSALVPFEALKLVAGLVLLAPYVPMLFMGEEYGETAPFRYFVSHRDPRLVETARRGRREEFAAFSWEGEPPDPQAEETFLVSRLDHDLRAKGQHAALLALHRELLRLRRTTPALARASKEGLEVRSDEERRLLVLRRRAGSSAALALFNLGGQPQEVTAPEGDWRRALDSADPRRSGDDGDTDGPLDGDETVRVAPRSFVLLVAGAA